MSGLLGYGILIYLYLIKKENKEDSEKMHKRVIIQIEWRN